MRAFAGKLLLAAMPCLFVAGVNYHVDPAHLFGVGLETGLGTLTAGGQAVVVPRVFETRLAERAYLQHLQQWPEVVALGSSRALPIHGTVFPGRRFVNSAVYAASIEDLVAIAGMYDSAGHIPREIVLDLDPWLLNQQSGLTGWRFLAGEYGRMAQRLGFRLRGLTRFVRPTADRYLELFSPAYFQISAPLLFAPTGAEALRPVDPVPGEYGIVLPDGSRPEGRVRRDSTVADVAKFAQQDLAAGFYVGHFTALDPFAQQQFERLVDYLMNAGTRVTLVLLPCHPILYEAFTANPAYRMVAAQDAYLRAFARQSGVRLIGSYDPVAAGCSEAEFYDGWHPRESCVNRVLASD